MTKDKISIIKDPELIDSVQSNYRSSAHASYIDSLVNGLLKPYKIYLLGGAVRDPIINYLYDRNISTGDFDLLVDDSEREFPIIEMFRDLEGLTLNNFSSPKWKPEKGIEIDVVAFSNVTMIKNLESDDVSLETVLKSTDFNTGAIAYDMAKPTIYSYGALEAIKKQEIEIAYVKGLALNMLLSRLALQSEKLGFSLGPKAKKLIADKYTPQLDERIKYYLEYKEMPEKYDFVIKKLREITKTR